MLNVYGAVGIFILILAVAIYSYTRHPEKLIVYHKYSTFMDILSWIGGVLLMVVVWIYHGIRPEYNYLLWFQFLAGAILLNTHVIRFVIRLKTKEKYHHSSRDKKG